MVQRHAEATLLAVLLLVTVATAHAQRRRLVPLHVKMVAYVGAIAGKRPEFTWTVMHQRKVFSLNVVRIIMLDGRATPLDIDFAVSPYRVQFQLAGEKSAVQRLLAAPPGQHLQIIAFMRLDPTGRYLMLDSVEPAAATPTPGHAGR